MGSVRGRLRRFAATSVALGVAALVLGAGLHIATAQDSPSVTIVDHTFEPALIGVSPGQTVTWTNSGSEPHTVTSDDSTFSSGRLAPGESFSQTFEATGSFTYRCRIHPSMTGTVVVNGGGKGAAVGAGPKAVPVVGVGTAASGSAGTVALLIGAAAIALGAVATVLRRA